MTLPEGSNNFVDQNNCPPKLEVKLKGKASEWQDRAKTYNTDSFAKNSPKIKAIQVSAESLLASSTLNGIIINADDQSIINYIRTLSADKPVNIVNMQKVLRDECDKTIAIDGRVGDQTIAAMESIIKRIATIVNKQIPGYSEALAVVSKIDALIDPKLAILPAMPTKPAIDNRWSLAEGELLIAKKRVEEMRKNINGLLTRDYQELGAYLNDKGELLVLNADKKTRINIITVSFLQSEDSLWDNIHMALEAYMVKQNPQKPENTVGINPVTKPETKIDGKIQLSPEQAKEAQWKQIQLEIITYARSKGCEVTLIKTDKIAKDIHWVDNTNKDRLALNQFYEMKIIKDGKQIGSKEFMLGTDNIVTDKPGSDKINPNLAQLLKGYIDSVIFAPAFTERVETINGVEVSSDAMNEFKKLGISLDPSKKSGYLIDMNFTDGKVFQLSTNGKTQRMCRENGILNQGGLDNTTQKVEYKNGTFVLTDKESGKSNFTIREITQSPTVNTEVSSDSTEKIETDLNNIINQVKEYAKTQGLNLKMEQTFKTHTLLIYNISIQKIHEFTWTEIEKYHGVNLKGKVDIQGEVNEIKTRIDEYIKLEKKRRDKKLFSSVNDQTDNKSQNSFDKLNPEYGSSIESDGSTIQGDTLNSTTNNEGTENNPKVKITTYNSTLKKSVKNSGSSSNSQVGAGWAVSQKQ